MTDFEPATLEQIDAADLVRIRVGDHEPRQIWVVVVDGALHAQSWRGRPGHGWTNALLTAGSGALLYGDHEVEVAADAVSDEATRDAIYAAISAKYSDTAAEYVPPFAEPASRATALRFRPA